MAETTEHLWSRLARYVANALRYWEPRRLIYNGVLALVVLAHVALRWPVWNGQLSADLLIGAFILAVLANIAYCAVYGIDIFVQFSGLDAAWRVGRIVVLTVGTAFAAAITHIIMRQGP